MVGEGAAAFGVVWAPAPSAPAPGAVELFAPGDEGPAEFPALFAPAGAAGFGGAGDISGAAGVGGFGGGAESLHPLTHAEANSAALEPITRRTTIAVHLLMAVA